MKKSGVNYMIVLLTMLQFAIPKNSFAKFKEKSTKESSATILLDSVGNDKLKSNIIDNFKISGYLETYYSYDFGNPQNHNRPGFAYSFNRHNEVNLNLGFIKLAYNNDKIRANLALMTGSYANANLAEELGVLKNLFEANAGFKVLKNKNLWVDAGVFSSHIGFESAIGKDCWNLTRSIMADNSPYYESGAKISYTSDNTKWFLSGLVLNGWQRIQRLDGNNTPSIGHQITYKPNSKFTFNNSAFIGNDKPDSVRQMRYFHNFYALLQLHQKFGLTLGFDIGAEQKSKGSSQYNFWYTPVIIARYALTNKINIAARAEYYNDRNGVKIPTNTSNGFQTLGYSINLDYNISKNLVWRIEARGFNSKDKIFTSATNSRTQNYFVTTSLAFSF